MRVLLILAGLAVTLPAQAQEIYRWVDKDGIVHYSDQPGAANAQLIDVIEPNAYDASEAASSAGGGGGEDEDDSDGESPYTSLSIVSPSPDQVFFGADAVVSVQADLSGTLRPDDSVVFIVNGTRHPAEGLSLELPGLERGSYFLRASILDRNGQPVITSQQTTFHVRLPSINAPQSPQAPKPPPKPRPRPATPPRT